MGKKSKNKPAKTNLWMVVGGAAIMICIAWFAIRYTNASKTEQSAANQFPVTLVATLSPGDFTGKAKLAYEAAKEIPEILAQLPCFCGCMESIGHKSNLDCFADLHGSDCDMCQNIALDAQTMHSKGDSVSKIRDAISAAYSQIH